MATAIKSAQLNILQPEGRTKGGETGQRSIYRALMRGDVITDCIATFLLAAGLCLALLPMTILDGGMADTLRAIILTIVALVFLRIRWWIGPALFVLASGAIALNFYLTEQIQERIDYYTAFYAWLYWGASEHEVFSASFEVVLLRYLVICGITLVLFFIMRRLFSILLVAAAFGGVMFTAEYLGYFRLVLPISLFMAGVIVLLPRVYSRCVKGRKKGSAGRAYVQMIAIPGAALTVLLSLWITPESGSYMQWRRLSNFFFDVGYLVNSPLQTQRSIGGNFELGILGFEPVAQRLGGPAVLPDWHILTVTSNHPVLLRGSVLDYYTGISWVPGAADSALRFESILWRSQRADAFDFNMPIGGREAQELFDTMTVDVTMQIIYEAEFYTTLFSTLGMHNFSFTTPGLSDEVFFNARSELYLAVTIPEHEVVTIHARVPDINAPDFAENFVLLEQLVGPDPQFADIHARYTVLPYHLPQSVRDAAIYAAGDETSPFMQATAIARWLGENFYYTLNPTMPPPYRDFVDYFLETGEGYCTYYASAMAVMARVVGLPSRYVTGFALERDGSRESTYFATGRTAHAWTEIYFYGVGWVTFDPLRWNAYAPLNVGIAQGDLSNVGDWYLWDDYYDYWYGEFGWWELPEFVAVDPVDMRPHIFGSLGALLLGVIIYIIFSWNSKYRKYSPSRVTKRIPDITARFSFYYTDIMNQLSLLGFGIQPGETLAVYPGRINPRIGRANQVSELSVIAKAQMRLHFANLPPTAADVETAGELHAMLEDKLREKFSPLAYLWRRGARMK